MNRILEVNPSEKWVVVEPGVILAELNKYLESYGLFLVRKHQLPTGAVWQGCLETIHAELIHLIYGSVRDHILEAEVILSDGSEAMFQCSDQ